MFNYLRAHCHAVVWLLFVAATVWIPSVGAETIIIKVVLGTATKGGGFQLFGQTLAEVINATDTGLLVDAIATKGSKQNLTLLEQGEIDIGLVEGNAARQALDLLDRQPVKKLEYNDCRQTNDMPNRV